MSLPSIRSVADVRNASFLPSSTNSLLLHPELKMKLIVFLAALIEAGPLFQALAEAPQEYGAPNAPAPYPPAGWRPQGERFLLPAEFLARYVQPQVEYGPPPASIPSITTTTEAEVSTTEVPTTTELPTTTEPSLNEDGSNQNANQGRRFGQLRNEPSMVAPLDTGFYYVYLPDGRLQRVNYITRPVAARLESSDSNAAHQLGSGIQTQLTYQEVQPLAGPIYQYGSPLMRIFRK